MASWPHGSPSQGLTRRDSPGVRSCLILDQGFSDAVLPALPPIADTHRKVTLRWAQIMLLLATVHW